MASLPRNAEGPAPRDRELPIRIAASSPRDEHPQTGWGGFEFLDDEALASPSRSYFAAPDNTTMQDRIQRIQRDEHELRMIWPTRLSANRYAAFLKLYTDELASLERDAPFDAYSQEDRVDYLLFQNYLKGHTRRLELEQKGNQETEPLLPFAPALVGLCEAQTACRFDELEPKHVATVLHNATASVLNTTSQVEMGKLRVSKEAAWRAIHNIAHLRHRVAEMYRFFKGYNPTFDWWVQAPMEAFDKALDPLTDAILTKLTRTHSNAKDEIIGQPIGKDGLLVELEAEMIPYTPNELLDIANDKYAWCEKEMKKAASELGFGDDWKAALRHVQGIYLDPGQQPQLIKSLVDDAADYVKRNQLVSVPPLAEQWTMSMMSASDQKVNPFFLGGPLIIVSYPTAEMSHGDKLMSMRGNGPHLSKATAFHEMIPGHHLQGFVGARSRAYRNLFSTPFYIEGWAMYWELVFWDRGDFFSSPEDRIGTLFWRMHRCARILFSIKFHLGQLTPQQCVDLLVDMVGHERNTAEGEVRRSLIGAYGPLYQAGYYLGAMQLYALRGEVLSKGIMGEKEFHDRILTANQMPIELLRALIMGHDLSKDYKSKWRFYAE